MSLVYFFPGGTPCQHLDEEGVPQCSPPGEPNVCMEGDWSRKYGRESWTRPSLAIGGSDSGGMFQGRMECSCTRDQDAENEVNLVYMENRLLSQSFKKKNGRMIPRISKILPFRAAHSREIVDCHWIKQPREMRITIQRTN